MITNSEIKQLQGLTEKPPSVIRYEDKVLLHARWFTLELDPAMLSKDIKTVESVPHEAKNWRDALPREDASYGQAFRTVNEDDGVELIKLVSDAGVARIHPSVYEVVTKHIPESAFYVAPGVLSNVTVRSKDSVIGCVAQIKV